MWPELAVSYGDIESVRGFKGTGFEVPVDNRSRSVSPAWFKPRLQHFRVDIGIGIEKYLGCNHKTDVSETISIAIPIVRFAQCYRKTLIFEPCRFSGPT